MRKIVDKRSMDVSKSKKVSARELVNRHYTFSQLQERLSNLSTTKIITFLEHLLPQRDEEAPAGPWERLQRTLKKTTQGPETLIQLSSKERASLVALYHFLNLLEDIVGNPEYKITADKQKRAEFATLERVVLGNLHNGEFSSAQSLKALKDATTILEDHIHEIHLRRAEKAVERTSLDSLLNARKQLTRVLRLFIDAESSEPTKLLESCFSLNTKDGRRIWKEVRQKFHEAAQALSINYTGDKNEFYAAIISAHESMDAAVDELLSLIRRDSERLDEIYAEQNIIENKIAFLQSITNAVTRARKTLDTLLKQNGVKVAIMPSKQLDRHHNQIFENNIRVWTKPETRENAFQAFAREHVEAAKLITNFIRENLKAKAPDYKILTPQFLRLGLEAGLIICITAYIASKLLPGVVDAAPLHHGEPETHFNHSDINQESETLETTPQESVGDSATFYVEAINHLLPSDQQATEEMFSSDEAFFKVYNQLGLVRDRLKDGLWKRGIRTDAELGKRLSGIDTISARLARFYESQKLTRVFTSSGTDEFTPSEWKSTLGISTKQIGLNLDESSLGTRLQGCLDHPELFKTKFTTNLLRSLLRFLSSGHRIGEVKYNKDSFQAITEFQSLCELIKKNLFNEGDLTKIPSGTFFPFKSKSHGINGIIWIQKNFEAKRGQKEGVTFTVEYFENGEKITTMRDFEGTKLLLDEKPQKTTMPEVTEGSEVDIDKFLSAPSEPDSAEGDVDIDKLLDHQDDAEKENAEDAEVLKLLNIPVPIKAEGTEDTPTFADSLAKKFDIQCSAGGELSSSNNSISLFDLVVDAGEFEKLKVKKTNSIKSAELTSWGGNTKARIYVQFIDEKGSDVGQLGFDIDPTTGELKYQAFGYVNPYDLFEQPQAPIPTQLEGGGSLADSLINTFHIQCVDGILRSDGARKDIFNGTYSSSKRPDVKYKLNPALKATKLLSGTKDVEPCVGILFDKGITLWFAIDPETGNFPYFIAPTDEDWNQLMVPVNPESPSQGFSIPTDLPQELRDDAEQMIAIGNQMKDEIEPPLAEIRKLLMQIDEQRELVGTGSPGSESLKLRRIVAQAIEDAQKLREVVKAQNLEVQRFISSIKPGTEQNEFIKYRAAAAGVMADVEKTRLGAEHLKEFVPQELRRIEGEPIGSCIWYGSEYESSSPDTAHDISANRFTGNAGGELKKGDQQMNIINPVLGFEITKENQFRFTWGCYLGRASSPESADWQFDQRGTFLSDTDTTKAQARVEADNAPKVQKMIDAGWKQLGDPVVVFRPSLDGKKWWCLITHFFTKAKQPGEGESEKAGIGSGDQGTETSPTLQTEIRYAGGDKNELENKHIVVKENGLMVGEGEGVKLFPFNFSPIPKSISVAYYKGTGIVYIDALDDDGGNIGFREFNVKTNNWKTGPGPAAALRQETEHSNDFITYSPGTIDALKGIQAEFRNDVKDGFWADNKENKRSFYMFPANFTQKAKSIKVSYTKFSPAIKIEALNESNDVIDKIFFNLDTKSFEKNNKTIE